ncbi:hypothetical protein GCM10007049_28390 [Echinicola pacifica]|uniref:HD/PDEase domain-containing protein n=1 Tax=Echinicola pacifica TaxID=346377 RepID=A0A918UT47_9BACT|nr:Pycsar system effector family protein [Echinicola pacifica]GGZ33081.1 hypothetical protein GCM10007049_28390 [Echinicola pacifica]
MDSSAKSLLFQVEHHIRNLYFDNKNELLCYHNLEHTLDVVHGVKEIAEALQLGDEDKEILQVAAWFHDSGCWIGTSLQGHESRGAELAHDFLMQKGLDTTYIERVKGCIQATRMPQSPESVIEKIICDADLFHLGSEHYLDRAIKLREELVNLNLLDISELSWLKSNLMFIGNHSYHTEYCKRQLGSGKQKNMAKLVQKIEEMEKAKKVNKKKGKKSKETERGVETLFRTTSKNHLELSSIADNKANIMISVNSIILTIIVSVLLRKLEEFPNFIIPTVMLLCTSLVTMVFAILATRPNVTSGQVTKEDIDNKTANLLYFGNFHNMSLQDYEAGMKKMMNDADFLYGSLTRDIYFLGRVLGKKYRLLRKSYTVFMFGFILSILAFAIASVFFPVDTY